MRGRELVAPKPSRAADDFDSMLTRYEALSRLPDRSEDEQFTMDKIAVIVMGQLLPAYRYLQKDNVKVRRSLDDRRTVDMAKSVLIRGKRLTEPQAYHWLRQKAMDYQQPIGDIARRVIDGETL